MTGFRFPAEANVSFSHHVHQIASTVGAGGGVKNHMNLAFIALVSLLGVNNFTAQICCPRVAVVYPCSGAVEGAFTVEEISVHKNCLGNIKTKNMITAVLMCF